MQSLQIEARAGPEQQQEEGGTGNRVERAEWVLNSPDPPGLCHEIINSIKKSVFPKGSKPSSSSTKQTPSKAAAVVSFFHGLFPILIWGRNYKAVKFRNDVMSGLTLASLSIPQVHTHMNFLSFSSMNLLNMSLIY